MKTFVSVIVPVYNIEQYLERCINSILDQTYDNFELILMDDGSTDSSADIIDRYEKKDKRVKAFHQKNGGSSKARNEALKLATGEYISFIDSDDYIEKDFLEHLTAPVNEALDRGEIPPYIVQIGRDEIDEEGNRRPDVCTPPAVPEFVESHDFFFELLMHRGDCSFCTKLTKKELFNKLEFPVGELNEDFKLLIQMLDEIKGIFVLDTYGYHVFYRVGSNSRVKDKNEFSRVFKDCVANADLVEEIVKEKFPNLMEVAVRFALFQRLDYMLHIPISKMNGQYEGYKDCVKYIRAHWPGLCKNRYLTKKNKVYLTLFAVAPKATRQIHAFTMRIRGIK